MAAAQCASVVFEEDFEAGLPPGWMATGPFWHISSDCNVIPGLDDCVDGQWMYFGVDGACNYYIDPFTAAVGVLSTPWISLPALPDGGSIVLDYCEAEQTECEVEQFWLRVEELGGPTTSYYIRCEGGPAFMGGTPPYPLRIFAGKTVRLHWDFDAVDHWNNWSDRGILIDNIRITAYTGSANDCDENLIPDDCDSPSAITCSSLPNSTGQTAGIAVGGSAVISCNEMRLEASNCPPNKLGIFFYGSAGAGTPFGDGTLCVASPITRLKPPVLLDGSGAGEVAVDFPALPAGGAILPGSSWTFQFWYRDPAAGGAGFNTSHGMRVDFAL